MNRILNSEMTILAVSLLLNSSIASAQDCGYVAMKPGMGKITTDKLKIDLGQGADPVKPRAWQGPIKITQASGASCKVDPDVNIVEQPIYQDGQHLLVSTYSGSERVVFAVDAATCKVLWQSKPFVGLVRLKNNSLRLGKKTVKLGPHCIP